MELRLKQPLAERVDCSFLSSTGVAPWLLRIDCSPQNLAQLQARLKEQLDGLRAKEISPEELRLAVSRLEGQQQVACKNSTGLVLQLRNLGLQPNDAPPLALHTCRVIKLPRATVR